MAAGVLGRTRSTAWEALPVALAVMHGVLLVRWPSIPLVAVGLWWNANTISHHFIHRPFFRSRELNAGFSCYLSLVLGFPQSLWRARHLAHHLAIVSPRERNGLKIAPLDLLAAIGLWATLLIFTPGFLLAVYLPGFLFGLGLCYLQGYYEHKRGTVSHYGWLYNFMMFNDGYHIEHHARPAASWRELPRHRASHSTSSRWPAVLRWLDCLNLCALERIVLRFALLQRFVVDRHERAFRKLLRGVSGVGRVAIVGGGLFPRTALILRRVLPDSKLVLIDQSDRNLEIARSFFTAERVAFEHPGEKGTQDFVNARFEPEMPCEADLLIIPLAFEGDRDAFYDRPPASMVLVHDWIWRKRGSSAVVSWLLLKRLNLVKR